MCSRMRAWSRPSGPWTPRWTESWPGGAWLTGGTSGLGPDTWAPALADPTKVESIAAQSGAAKGEKK